MNHNVIVCLFQRSHVIPVKGSFDPQRGHKPQVENHCSTTTQEDPVYVFIILVETETSASFLLHTSDHHGSVPSQ